MVSVLSRREIKTKTWIAFYSHLLAQTHTLLNIHIFAGQTTFFVPLFYLFWQLYLNKYPRGSSLTCHRVVISINNIIVSGLKTTSFFCQLQSHFLFQRVKKKEEESGVSLTSWWFQLTHTWSGWWTMVKARFWQKLRACQISSAAPESFTADLWSLLSMCGGQA